MTPPLQDSARPHGRIIYLELLVLVLSLYSLGALTVGLFVPLAPDTRQLLRQVDDCVCGVFLLDFIVHLRLAPSRRAFWRTGWIDLLSSIPEIGWLRWGRAFGVFRILRSLRSFAAVHRRFSADRARGTFVLVGLMSLIAVLFATIAVLEAERGAAGSNIHSAGDALWWAFATITTIGYGDRFPVTLAGRIVAVVLVVFGLSFFGTFTAYVASFFLEKAQLQEESELHRLIREVHCLREKIDQLDAARTAAILRPPDAAASPATRSATAPPPGGRPG